MESRKSFTWSIILLSTTLWIVVDKFCLHIFSSHEVPQLWGEFEFLRLPRLSHLLMHQQLNTSTISNFFHVISVRWKVIFYFYLLKTRLKASLNPWPRVIFQDYFNFCLQKYFKFGHIFSLFYFTNQCSQIV